MNRATHNQASITSTDQSGLRWRLAYVGYLGSVALCSVLACIAVFRADAICLGSAMVAGALAMGLRYVLRRSPERVEEAERFEDEFCPEAAINDSFREAGAGSKAGELAGLLQEWDGLERARGSGRFDPWALQAVRSEIRVTVQENDVLRRLLGPGC